MKKIIFSLVVLVIFLSSCGGSSSVDIINPEAEYRYFFGATCPYCQELNKIVEEEDLFSKIEVEKREIYFNDENREMFLALLDEIGAEGSGVPFVYDTVTWEYVVGVPGALEMFSNRLGENQAPEENTANTGAIDTISEDMNGAPAATETNTWVIAE